jgi:alginate O-acetyltransferase complex protein AlgJ
MPETSLQQTREELARREVGQTKVGRGTAWLLVAQFLLVVGAVPLSEILHDLRNPEATDNLHRRLSRLVLTVLPPAGTRRSEAAQPLFSRILSRNHVLIRELERFKDEAEDVSLLAQRLRPPTQYLLAGLGAGNEQAYIGHTPWLFYRDGVDYVTGPGFHSDARLAILQLKEQLDVRGIRLVVMPTPVKPIIHPEHFSRRFEGREDPLRPDSYPTFIRELDERGVLVFDAAPALLEAKRRSGTSQYLMTDTHWRPEALELVADRLRDFVTQHADLAPAPSPGYISQPVEVTNLGDVARMLDLPKRQARYPEEAVRLRQIRTAENALWRPSRSADVLLLGDSFSNVYSLAEMGWGESAGLAAQLRAGARERP